MASTQDDQEPKFPPEIIEEITSRLPAKSLARFKSVSKSWLQMISDPIFVKQHLTRNQTLKILFASNRGVYSSDPKSLNNRLILSSKIKNYPFKTQSVSSPDSWIQFTGSANGLICICPPPLDSYTFFIYNPTTGNYKEIPDNQILHPDKNSNATSSYGFGYSHALDDYKFVKVDSGKVVLVYSLKSNSWKKLPENFPYNPWYYLPPFHYMPGISLNGSIHWVQSRGNLANHAWSIAVISRNSRDATMINVARAGEQHKLPYSCVIAAFDLDEEKFVDIRMPNPGMDFRKYDLGVLGGKLCLMHYNGVHNDFWIMYEYGVKESWNRIVLSLGYSSLRPLCFAEDGDNKGALMVINQDRLVKVDVDNGSCVDLKVKRMRGIKFESDVLVETLVSPASF